MKREQQGYVLILTILALTIGASIALAASVRSAQIKTNQQQQQITARALYDAKQALIYDTAWGNIFDTPGGLPCPASTDGYASSSCSAANASAPQRLPFNSMAINMLLDGGGECLWYSISPDYRGWLTADKRSDNKANQHPLNPDNYGSLLYRTALSSNNTKVIAAIIAPGAVLTGQNRVSTSLCNKGGSSNFLENYDASTGTFTGSQADTTQFNDQMVVVTREELMKPLLSRVLLQFASDGSSNARGLRWFFQSGRLNKAGDLTLITSATGQQAALRMDRSKFTGPVDTDLNSSFQKNRQFDEMFGSDKKDFIYDADTACNGVVSLGGKPYANPASWLCFNQWYKYIEYVADDSDSSRLKATLTLKLNRDNAQSYQCSLTITSDATGKDAIQCSTPP